MYLTEMVLTQIWNARANSEKPIYQGLAFCKKKVIERMGSKRHQPVVSKQHTIVSIVLPIDFKNL